ncbi:hypothetical protein Hanom_Chr03g00220051 [Helianthus anomalus]
MYMLGRINYSYRMTLTLCVFLSYSYSPSFHSSHRHNEKMRIFMALLVVVIAVCYMMWAHGINDEGMISAVLVAGCKYGYDDCTVGRYMLRILGLEKGHVIEDNVVVMMSNDIANHYLNREHMVIKHELD